MKKTLKFLGGLILAATISYYVGLGLDIFHRKGRIARTTPDQKMDLSHREGTLTFWIKDRRWLKDRHRYIFWDQKINQAKIVVFKDTNMILNVFIDHPSVGRQELKADVSNLDKDRDHFFALTWSPKEVILYLNAKQVDIRKLR